MVLQALLTTRCVDGRARGEGPCRHRPIPPGDSSPRSTRSVWPARPTGWRRGRPTTIEQIRRALQDLGGLAARTYLVDMEPGGEDAVLALADRYREQGLLGHATLGYLRDDFDLARWTELVRTLVGRHGDQLRSLQITNEPNLSFMDGSKPYVLDALVHGRPRRQGRGVPPRATARRRVRVGSPERGQPPAVLDRPRRRRHPGVHRGRRLRRPQLLRRRLRAARRARPDRRSRHRHPHRSAHPGPPRGRYPGVSPIRVTENGWPTGTNPFSGRARTDERQAEVLDAIVRSVHRVAAELHVTHYVLFGLRDADSSEPDLFHQFGIMRDDYTPKPAYETYRSLVRQLSR